MREGGRLGEVRSWGGREAGGGEKLGVEGRLGREGGWLGEVRGWGREGGRLGEVRG